MWAKAQDKSGQRVPYLDERCSGAELADLYELLKECKYFYNLLPLLVQSAVDEYDQNKKQFEQEWGKAIAEREELTCQKCRVYYQYKKGSEKILVCPECGDSKTGE